MRHLKRIDEELKPLPRIWQLKALAGTLNSFEYLKMTDCEFTYDHHLKVIRSIKEKLVGITITELNQLYDMLTNTGVSNLINHFSYVFTNLEKEHIENPDLSIWDFRRLKKLFSDINT